MCISVKIFMCIFVYISNSLLFILIFYDHFDIPTYPYIGSEGVCVLVCMFVCVYVSV